MFEMLPHPKPDAILAQMAPFKVDPRPEKMNLGVGVYMNEKGETIILDSVKEAEARLLAQEQTKSYVGMAGDLGYIEAMKQIVFGDDSPAGRIAGLQAPGGSGSLRVLIELVARVRPNAKVWLSNPTWPNHHALLSVGQIEIAEYPYFDTASCSVDFAAMAAKLRTLGPNDVVVLHGCCHNPTGANLTPAQWDEVAEIAVETGFVPFFDIAYQGFGDGLEEDAYSVRRFAATVKEMLVAVSCSKNFGIYRERVGCAFVMGADEEMTKLANENIQKIARGIYSMPPDHGASVVRIIWEDSQLRQQWKAELKVMCDRMTSLRQQLAESFRAQSGGNRFDFITVHRGMFSLLGLTPEQVERLRDEHAIYLIADSRMNIAGMQEQNIDRFVAAVLAVTQA
ncbi:MAG: aromatic amino acid aminotransferase [Proteobacteria bacterium]|nr:MAG: aromatic amino acid aminotransferase [Pseudomonadota bacterium]